MLCFQIFFVCWIVVQRRWYSYVNSKHRGNVPKTWNNDHYRRKMKSYLDMNCFWCVHMLLCNFCTHSSCNKQLVAPLSPICEKSTLQQELGFVRVWTAWSLISIKRKYKIFSVSSCYHCLLLKHLMDGYVKNFLSSLL